MCLQKGWREGQGVWSCDLCQCWVWRRFHSKQTATIQLKPGAKASQHFHMSCRHCASQLSIVWTAACIWAVGMRRPSVEHRGWHVRSCPATSTTWPLCGTSPDCYWCRFEKQGQLSSSSQSSPMLSRVSGSNERSTRLPKRVLVLRTRRTRVILGTVAFLVPPPPHHSTPSVCLNKGPTR